MAAEMDATPMGARFQKGTKLLSCYRKSNIAGILIGRLVHFLASRFFVLALYNDIFLFLFYLNWLRIVFRMIFLIIVLIARIEN